MEPAAYRILVELEKTHWYQRSRMAAISGIFRKYLPAGNYNILDAGCGTGGTTNFLLRFGEVTGLEPSSLANGLIRENYPELKIIHGKIDDLPELTEQKFDIITVLGVLYHKEIHDPAASVKILYDHLKPGGYVLWHESVYPSLRRKMDEISYGARRFLPGEMIQILTDSGLTPVFKTHLSSFAFPVAWLRARLQEKNGSNPDLKTPSAPVNRFFYGLSRLEMKVALHLFPVPFGVSMMILARKEE